MKKKIVMVIIVIIIMLTGLTACNTTSEKKGYSDLAFIKVNNVMAEWRSIEYNYTHKGSNKLYVTVPYTAKLCITDFAVSPKAVATFYNEDNEVISDIKDIDIDKERSIYVSVANGKSMTDYEVAITVDQRYYKDGGYVPPTDNRYGHIYFPDNVTEVTYEDKVYEIIRDNDQFKRLGYNTNYILANDLTFPRGEYDNNNGEDTYSGIFYGGNYTITVNDNCSSLFGSIIENGIISNLIVRSDREVLSMRSAIAGSVARDARIINCVNYVNMSRNDEVYGICLGDFNTYNIPYDTEKYIVINCLNYGNLASNGARKAAGIAHAGGVKNSHNLGEITSAINSGGIVHYNVYPLTNCTNLGRVNALRSAGGIAAFGYAKITYCANYAKITIKKTPTKSPKKSEYLGDLIGIADKNIEIINCK